MQRREWSDMSHPHLEGERLLEHFKASSDEHWVVVKWRKSVAAPLRIAVVRSEQGFAAKAEEVTERDATQIFIYEGVDEYCQDQDVIGGVDYYYTCFARLEDGFWERQHDYHIKPKIAHGYKRVEVFDRDSPAYLQAMDRMRAGFWLMSNQPG